jgi:Glycosyl transferase family 2
MTDPALPLPADHRSTAAAADPVSFAAIVGVKDDVELIQPAIEHLERLGVQEIAVIDGLSTDGTQDVLRELQAQGRIALHFFDSEAMRDQDDRGLAQQLIEGFRSDWVLIQDADEFLLTSCGPLAALPEIRSGTLDIVTLPRRNLVPWAPGTCVGPLPASGAFEDSLVVSDPIFKFWADPANALRTPWILAGVMPRALARREAIRGVQMGAHGFETTEGARRDVARSAFVAHLPFTTFARFERKMINVGQLIRSAPEDFAGNSMHWLRWHRIHEEGALQAEFDRQILLGPHLQELQDAGQVTSVRAFLDRLARDPQVRI